MNLERTSVWKALLPKTGYGPSLVPVPADSILKFVALCQIGGDVFSEFYEFGNGCLCCTVKDDLVTTLEMLLTRRYVFLAFFPMKITIEIF
jgi:CobW/HypB/UreG, nucleotide-binding domain